MEGKVLTSSSRKTSEICQVIWRTACQHHRLAGLSSTRQSEAFAWKGRPGVRVPVNARILFINTIPALPRLNQMQNKADISTSSTAEVRNVQNFYLQRLGVALRHNDTITQPVGANEEWESTEWLRIIKSKYVWSNEHRITLGISDLKAQIQNPNLQNVSYFTSLPDPAFPARILEAFHPLPEDNTNHSSRAYCFLHFRSA